MILFIVHLAARSYCVITVHLAAPSSIVVTPLTEPCLRYSRTRLLNSTLHIEISAMRLSFRFYTFFITEHDVYFPLTLLLLQWPFLFWHYPASSVLRHCPTPYRT